MLRGFVRSAQTARLFPLLTHGRQHREAEDLTQEAFLQLYRKISTFRGESAFSTWLHRLAVNVVLMHLRKKGLPEVSLEETLEPQQEDGPKKDIGTRDNVLAGSIDRVNLERAIESLPRDTALSSCCMTWKVTNTTKSRR